jgi:mono/diheme cytochrome c family protein
MKNKIFLVLALTLAVFLLLAACSQTPTATSVSVPTQAPATQVQEAPTQPQQPATQSSASASDGKSLFETRCSACHNIRRATSQKRSADEWKSIVQDMISRGAQLNNDEQALVVKYLSENYSN